MGRHRIHPTARHVFCRHTHHSLTHPDSVHFKLSSFPKPGSDTWWMDRLWSQLPDPHSFYVLSLNSHFCGADLRKGAQCPWTFATPASHSHAIVSWRLCAPQGSMSVPPTSDLTTRAPSIFAWSTYSLHFIVKQSSHLRGGQAPRGERCLSEPVLFLAER